LVSGATELAGPLLSGDCACTFTQEFSIL
jgi:hypothetical protein